MLDLQSVVNSQLLVAGLAMVAVAGIVLTFLGSFQDKNSLEQRMKAAVTDREQIRNRERARLANEKTNPAISLRAEPQGQIKNIVERYKLRAKFADEETLEQLRMAGFRGTGPLYTFVFAKVASPILFFVVALVYCVLILQGSISTLFMVLISLCFGALGFWAPKLYVKNLATKRQLAIKKAWPDALDLLLICVESGMSVEAAFERVGSEIGLQSKELAEELALTNAELSYLGERRQAYDNLGKRTGLDSVKSVMMALVQAERYGTPVGQAIRVMADDNREVRMQEAEKKAAALPPKLTVPMIVFFLPVLFCIIIGPAAIQISRSM